MLTLRKQGDPMDKQYDMKDIVKTDSNALVWTSV
jgi:hypothetical protein